MLTKFFKTGVAIAVTALLMQGAALAETLKGKVVDISNKAKVIQLKVGKKTLMIKFDGNTKFSPKPKKGEAVIVVVDGKYAKSVKLKLAKLPKNVKEIKTDELCDKIEKGAKIFVVDSRPNGPYNQGHLPGSINIDVKEMKTKMSMLPKDKNMELVFYCGGITWGMSPKAAGLAVKAGYKNVKAYIQGVPGWKSTGKPLEVSPKFVWKNAGDNSIVVIDGRKTSTYKRGHVKGAYGFIKVANNKRGVKGLKNKKALIVVYGEDDADNYKICRKFNKKHSKRKKNNYKSVVLMAGGFDAYEKAGYPTGKGNSAAKVTYVKKLVPGAVAVNNFVIGVEKGGAIILDVRTDSEVSKGIFKGATHIPLDKLGASLSKLPKDAKIYAHCASGARAGIAYNMLKSAGYKNARYLNATVKFKGSKYTID